ncbi:MAG: cysteine desulfurase [Planctomycetes bacterium]|nr:cysteine desulfurase [Planctomycetota bacterium]
MINFDQNATTPVDEAVLNELIRATREFSGNTSSGHSLGAKASKFLRECRERVANILHADDPDEIVFTSGGTESDNAAVRGIAFAMRAEHDRNEVITSAIEHRAVLAPCDWLAGQGFKSTVLPVDSDGVVNIAALRDNQGAKTALVSIMLANNEIGTIQPIAEISRLAHEVGAMVHTDAVQAAGKLAIDVNDLGVDSLSLSAHKFYGPKGIGVLYLRKGTPCECFMLGGTHEGGRRAGTVPLPQIAALTTALEVSERKRIEHGAELKALRDRLVDELLAKIPGSHLNGRLETCTPNTASIRFDGVYGGHLLKRMDEEGILASAGSACMWEITKPSHVLTALGLNDEQGGGTIRFSLGYGNTPQEVSQVANTLARLVPELRGRTVVM